MGKVTATSSHIIFILAPPETFSKKMAMVSTISFFLTLGLLRHFDLSYLYPFQGLSVIFISVAAAFLLREKLTVQLILGSLLITAGVVLVSIS